MNLITRLKNIWKLGESNSNILNKSILETFRGIDTMPIPLSDISFKYEGKPQAQIIKVDKIEETLDEIIKKDD